MTPVVLLTDGFLGNGAQPWKIPSLKDYPSITPRVAKEGDDYKPYARDPETLARMWALPGTKGLEHRIGGLEKVNVTGEISLSIRFRRTRMRFLVNSRRLSFAS